MDLLEIVALHKYDPYSIRDDLTVDCILLCLIVVVKVLSLDWSVGHLMMDIQRVSWSFGLCSFILWNMT